jgi:hypothetical protein
MAVTGVAAHLGASVGWARRMTGPRSMSAGTCEATDGGSAKESGLPIAAADQAGEAAEPSQSASAGTHDRPPWRRPRSGRIRVSVSAAPGTWWT